MQKAQNYTKKQEQQHQTIGFFPSTCQLNDKNQGPWTTKQQKSYILFLQSFKKELQNKHKRKDYKIFKKMAKYIKSRDGIQCRSHHMKLLRTHSKIRKIINYFRRRMAFEGQDYQDFRNELAKDSFTCQKFQFKNQLQENALTNKNSLTCQNSQNKKQENSKENIQINGQIQITMTNGFFPFIDMAGYPWNMSFVLMPTVISIEGFPYSHQ